MWKTPKEIFLAARIYTITGNYGSGKTELSLNLALAYAKLMPTALVDLDIVNPYFRSSEHASMLAQHGVRLLKPTYAMTNVDIPILPAEITSVFEGEEKVFFDVGGDDIGSVALGRYHPSLVACDAKMIFVINTRRPLTQDVQSIVELMHLIKERSRMEITAVCNNTNLGSETTLQDLLHGKAIVEEAAIQMHITSAFHCLPSSLVDQLPPTLAPFTYPITPFMRPTWL